MPKRGHQVHIISVAKFDYWTWVPVMIDWLGGRTDHLYCSTWALSRNNAQELFEQWDAGRIAPQAVHVLTGTYFKRRETAVFTMLLAGITERRGRYRAFANHSKVTLLANAKRGDFITVEGSANLTGNPRAEQYVVTNDKALHDFHRQFMNEVFDAPANRKAH